MHAIRTLLGGALFAFLLAGCKFDETEKANKNVADANDLLKEADDLQKEAIRLQDAAGSGSAPEDVKDNAGKCVTKFDEAAGKFDKAATLAKDAAGFNVTPVFKEYLQLKSEAFAKQGEAAKIPARLCKSMAETGMKDKAIADQEAVQKEFSAVLEEVKELSEKAEKIQKDNADQFTK